VPRLASDRAARATGDSLRVVIVDDHEMWRAAVRGSLEQAGIDVVGEASDLSSARTLVLRERPDVLLVDRVVGGVKNLQLIEEMAARLPATRVVVLSASGGDREVFDALEHGASGYLLKDISEEALVRAVRDSGAGGLAMSRQRASRALRHFVRLAKHDPAAAIRAGDLTPRQLEILRGLEEGLTNHQIAQRLTISSRTVEGHVAGVMRKLRVRDRADAARLSLEKREGGPPT
jgi:DNA-binding NarL/FixJ family response regulator